jgi:hypothetical protein
VNRTITRAGVSLRAYVFPQDRRVGDAVPRFLPRPPEGLAEDVVELQLAPELRQDSSLQYLAGARFVARSGPVSVLRMVLSVWQAAMRARTSAGSPTRN